MPFLRYFVLELNSPKSEGETLQVKTFFGADLCLVLNMLT